MSAWLRTLAANFRAVAMSPPKRPHPFFAAPAGRAKSTKLTPAAAGGDGAAEEPENEQPAQPSPAPKRAAAAAATPPPSGARRSTPPRAAALAAEAKMAAGGGSPAAVGRRATPAREAAKAAAPAPAAAKARRTPPPPARPPKRSVHDTLGGRGGGAGPPATTVPRAAPGRPAPIPPLPTEAEHPYAHPPPRAEGHYDPTTQRVRPLPPGCYVALSWNVASLGALLRKDPASIARLVATEGADAVALQETKLQPGKPEADAAARLGLPGWHVNWASSSAKKGYSGVAIATRHAPLSVRVGLGLKEADDEGRALAVELPRFWLATVYVPNSGEGLRRLGFRTDPGGWDESLAAWVAGLSSASGGKPVLLCGDLNCAREPVDIYAPSTHLRSAGFTPEERASFDERLLGRAGLADCLRNRIPPDQHAFTFWSYRGPGLRARNMGWRLDYFLAPADFDREEVVDAWTLPHVMGSDHTPVGLAVRGGAGG